MVPLWVIQYGLSNFLWFSNLTLLILLPAMWLGSRLLISMLAVAVVLPEIGWNLDFWMRLLFGIEVFGLVDYMFDHRIPLWARLVSLFHVPLPFVLVWLVWKCGYDPRALRWQTLLAWIVLPVSFFVSEPYQNINLVYGVLKEGRPTISPPIPLIILMLALPLLIYLPSHVALKRLFSSPVDARAPARDARASLREEEGHRGP